MRILVLGSCSNPQTKRQHFSQDSPNGRPKLLIPSTGARERIRIPGDRGERATSRVRQRGFEREGETLCPSLAVLPSSSSSICAPSRRRGGRAPPLTRSPSRGRPPRPPPLPSFAFSPPSTRAAAGVVGGEPEEWSLSLSLSERARASWAARRAKTKLVKHFFRKTDQN